MSTQDPLVVPPPHEILGQIRARQDEIDQLKRLLKVSVAASKAQEARARQQPVEELRGGPQHAS